MRMGLFGFGVLPVLPRRTLVPMWNPHPPKRWIRGAVKHEGSLRRFAKRYGALTRRGTVHLGKAELAARRLPVDDRRRRLRQIRLARTLRRF